MSQDSDHLKSGLPPKTADDGRNDKPAVEDPLVELARIVHRNKQADGSPTAQRVETTNYFDGLDDLADLNPAETQKVEPVVSPAPSEPFTGPSPDLVPELRPAIPAFDHANFGAPDPVPSAPNETMNKFNPIDTQAPASEPVADAALESALNSAVMQNLEENLSAELEDELIGAFQQSFEPAAPVRTEPQPAPFFEAPSAVSAPVPETSSSQVVQPSAGLGGYEAAQARVAQTPEPQPYAPEPAGHFGKPANDQPGLSADDLFGELKALEAELSRPAKPSISAVKTRPAAPAPEAVRPQSPQPEPPQPEPLRPEPVRAEASRPVEPAPAEPAGVEALFADLDFSPSRNRDVEPPAPEPIVTPEPAPAPAPVAELAPAPPPAEVVTEAVAASSATDDIDDMVWPEAAAEVPLPEEDETPPPPEGYDLEAVAKAMQESDPTLDGSGVLPPHPQEERAAAPGAEKNSRKGLYAAAAVAAVALIGGAVFLLSDGSSVDIPAGPPPIIAGLKGPLKVYPDEKPADDGPASKLIYDRVGTQNGGSQERLVLPEETKPAQLPPAPEGTAASDPLVPGAPKKVRTLVVRPDGTIISGQPDASTAPVRTVSTTPVRTTTEQPAATPAPTQPAPVAVAPVTTETPAPNETPATPVVSTPVTTAPIRTETPAIVSTTEITAEEPATPAGPVVSVVPRKKPAAPVQVARAPQATTPVRTTPVRTTTQSGPLDLNNPPAATTQTAAPARTTGQIAPGTYIVQVTSQRSESAARNAYAGLQRKYPGILGNRNAVIVSANIQDRGTFYRARIPAGSRAEAISLCESLKGAGGDCFVRRN